MRNNRNILETQLKEKVQLINANIQKISDASGRSGSDGNEDEMKNGMFDEESKLELYRLKSQEKQMENELYYYKMYERLNGAYDEMKQRFDAVLAKYVSFFVLFCCFLFFILFFCA